MERATKPTVRASEISSNHSFDWLTDRLDQEIRWYGGAARRSRIGYLLIRLLTLCAAAAITIASITGWAPPGWQPPWLAGILGASIVFLEGVQGLFRWRDQWLIYRATAEALKRERSLYLAQAGPYAGSETSAEALALLAVRAEQFTNSENANWRQLHELADDRPSSTQDRPPASPGHQGPESA